MGEGGNRFYLFSAFCDGSIAADIEVMHVSHFEPWTARGKLSIKLVSRFITMDLMHPLTTTSIWRGQTLSMSEGVQA